LDCYRVGGQNQISRGRPEEGIPGGVGVWLFLFSRQHIVVFSVILRCGFPYGLAAERTYFAGKDSGSGDGLLMQHKAQ